MQTGKRQEHTAKRLSVDFLAVVLVLATVSIPVHASNSLAARGLGLPVTNSVPAPTTYAADCMTPKTTFNLGDTVCVIGTSLTGLRFQWVDADGFSVNTTDITSDPQIVSFTLPTTDQSAIGGFFTANNLGRWRVNAVTLRNSVKTSVFFTVQNPTNPKVDLSIAKSSVGGDVPNAGEPLQFIVTVTNQGPNDAANAHFVDNVFDNATFNSLSQTSGPAFRCNGADCQIASLPNGATATFLLNFTAGASGGVLENTATISSDIPELNATDNSASSAPITVAASGTPPPTCNLKVTAPPPVTLFTGPGATSCGVVVNDLDATLGTGTATATCAVGDVTRSGVPAGNLFPVGETTVTYGATDAEFEEASANQIVTVVDNTPPAITCPQDMTLEPTCPTGAVATWMEPQGTDNCPDNATTAQTGGPANGSVFPIGTTSVSYTVTDAAGNHASCSFTVTVLTVAATYQNLETSVGASSLNGPEKQGLLPKLDASLAAFNRGQTNAACNTLSAFVNLVQDDVAHGSISAAQGKAWINSAAHIANTIGCTKNPCS